MAGVTKRELVHPTSRILCVDDEPAMLNILSRALRPHFEVVALADPVAALALIERGASFAVVISDMKMPQMDGAEFLAQVKRIAPSSTRLALTACLERELSADEVFGILTKPCPLALLHESVAAAVLQHLLLLRQSPSLAPPLDDRGEPPGAVEEAASESEVRARHSGLDSSLSIESSGGGIALPASGGGRVCLRLLGEDLELGPRATLLGRSPSCDIVLNDPRISARHARFFNSWRGLTIQDLSGTNDVRVDGRCVSGIHHLRVGNRIGIGPFEAEVRALRAAQASAPRALSGGGRQKGDPSEQRAFEAATGELGILTRVAERFFTRGQPAEAERALSPALDDLAMHCERGGNPGAQDTAMAVSLAARLAEELRAARWIDYIVRVFTALERPMPAPVVERLSALMLEISGTNLAAFRAYVAVLKRSLDRFDAAEHSLVSRIEGLERVILAA